MYMPRLRARQHEVFAVRNCASSFAASSRVVPVLEPVAAPNDLFTRRLGAIADEEAVVTSSLTPRLVTYVRRVVGEGLATTTLRMIFSSTTDLRSSPMLTLITRRCHVGSVRPGVLDTSSHSTSFMNWISP